MNTKLVWITPNAEAIIAYCARVSNPNNQDNPDYAKLLDYCYRNKHFSVFEMASACFEIKCSRAIARQILRHRSFSFQEMSGRYSVLPEIPILSDARGQDPKNRQNSLGNMSVEAKTKWREAQKKVWDLSHQVYKEALTDGLAKEVARNVLPEGMVESTMYMSGTIRSWIHYIEVRTGNGTQKEHMDIANSIKMQLCEVLPTVFKEDS
jgi:thymidylate synthase (FAD)